MAVGVDQAGHREGVGAVDDPGLRPAEPLDLVAGADGDDRPAATATASAQGRSRSPVQIRPTLRIRSAGPSCVEPQRPAGQLAFEPA